MGNFPSLVKKLKRSYWIPIVIACVLSVAAYVWLEMKEKTSFPIRHVIVKGEYWRVSQISLEKIIAPYTTKGYFFAHLFSLQQAIKREEPWIQSVSISRSWPDSFVIILQQKKAVAILNRTNLVTEKGEIFSPPINSFPPDLPVFIGPPQKAAELLKEFQVFTSLANSVKLSVTQLELSAEGNWSLRLDNKIVVMLGEDDIIAKFKRFTKVYEQVFIPQHREPRYVDMRYSHGMAVNWKS